jgi:coatomer subunit beta'
MAGKSTIDIKEKLVAKSDRVKSVDLHPTEPWAIGALYSGHVFLWDYESGTLVKQFDISDQPIRFVRFIARKQWFVAGSDDMHVYIYNYNTMDKIKQFEAHSDYIRSLDVHPTLPYILSSSDDMSIKLWDWDQGWQNTQLFEGHSHYVMMVVFNPKDTNTFASASLDHTIKIWGLGSPAAHFTLEGHTKGVNCLHFYMGGDRPFLVSGADDRTAKVWDYQTKKCVATLEGHTHNVSAVAFHPELPLILTGAEDGYVRIWNNATYRLENSKNYNKERVWSLQVQKGFNGLAIGYDEGCVVIKMGTDTPVVSMDNTGKIVMAKGNEVQQVNIKQVADEVVDGERLSLSVKELGTCDNTYPQSLVHNNNGRFVAVCGDGEYTIYTALAWRNKAYGPALGFVWSFDGEYAIRDSGGKVKIFNKNFKERKEFRPAFSPDCIFGGALIGLRNKESITFYDWENCATIQCIDDVVPSSVHWSDSGELVAVCCENCYYILRYNAEVVSAHFANGGSMTDGVEDGFELQNEVPEKVVTASWVGDSFIYTNGIGRLQHLVGTEIMTISHLSRPMYMLVYIPK